MTFSPENSLHHSFGDNISLSSGVFFIEIGSVVLKVWRFFEYQILSWIFANINLLLY